MHRIFPISLIGLVVTGIVFGLQVNPRIGILLMLLLAMYWFWSAALINASMIGVALEAIVGRVSRFWLLLPLMFYSGYWIVATLDHLALRQMASQYDVSNAQVATGFDPVRHALVFKGESNGAWLTQNYALPVAYTVNPKFPERYISHRMIERSVCTKVHESRAARAAFIHGVGFYDGDAIESRRMEGRFCALSMPEKPKLPLVVVEQAATKGFEKSLPVTRITTTITMPDGRRFKLFGGVASPLSWFPMPVMGCGLNSGAPSWGCSAGFVRNGFTPIVSGNTRYSRDSIVLAKALGLKPVAIEDRVGGDSTFVLAAIAEIEKAAAKSSP